MKVLQLTKGLVALVDDEDYDRAMSAGRWYAARHGRRTDLFYARRSTRRQPDGSRGGVFLHTFLTGAPYVDHRNGNGLDNRRANLRPSTHAENMHNRSKNTDNTSGFKGVSWHKGHGKWQASIRVDGRRRHLGYHRTAEDAAHAYDEAAREYFGEFAALNFPRVGERAA